VGGERHRRILRTDREFELHSSANDSWLIARGDWRGRRCGCRQRGFGLRVAVVRNDDYTVVRCTFPSPLSNNLFPIVDGEAAQTMENIL
jgi:hypothetical protein